MLVHSSSHTGPALCALLSLDSAVYPLSGLGEQLQRECVVSYTKQRHAHMWVPTPDCHKHTSQPGLIHRGTRSLKGHKSPGG